MAPPHRTNLSDSKPSHQSYNYSSKRDQDKDDSIVELKPLPEEEFEDLQDTSMEATEVTIETNVDPIAESTTTTTFVHLPFQVAERCDPPKVISWMKVEDPKKERKNQRHHPHQRPDGKGSKFIHNIFPFLKKEKPPVPEDHSESSKNKKKKKKKEPKMNDTAYITLFSIQVSVLGRVHLPSSYTSPEQMDDINIRASDVEPKKTVSGHVDRSETTPYVIHRTFDDFKHLSEMVVRLENIVHASSTTQSGEAPALTALKVRHPHPGIFQSFLKQVSTAKANQRAFNASSTTHGFHEEGAYERIVELNQYLENVWYWLLPEHTPQEHKLTAEQQKILQWFMPSPKSAHPDGRQLKDQKETDAKWLDLQRKYARGSKRHDGNTADHERSTGETAAQTTATSHHPSSSRPDNDVERNDSIKKEGSITSLPSLSSSASSSSSMCISPDEDRKGQFHNSNLNIRERQMTDSRRTSATVINSPDTFLKGLQSKSPVLDLQLENFEDIPVNTTDRGRHKGGRGQVEGSHPSDPNIVKRRMSLSNPFRSLSSSKNNNNSLPSRRQSSMYGSNMDHSKPQEICIWNTVTVKHPPIHYETSGSSSPKI
ncbi:hypothetical protein BGZ49_006658 [Haplosporangium sp. Z 27]|nr:hypothetical protein BGZ49_006658 [Haplosporangium sp. Z 27]